MTPTISLSLQQTPSTTLSQCPVLARPDQEEWSSGASGGVRQSQASRQPRDSCICMGWAVRVRSPSVLQSKLLCLSLLYLLTTLPLALYVSFTDSGRRRCLQPVPSPPKPLFQYPAGYGEHRHALPTSRALCSNPVAFAGL
jgi:hypothetical protein